MSYESEMIDLILEVEKRLTVITTIDTLSDNYIRALAAEDLKSYLSQIKKLVNEEKEVEIKQKL